VKRVLRGLRAGSHRSRRSGSVARARRRGRGATSIRSGR